MSDCIQRHQTVDIGHNQLVEATSNQLYPEKFMTKHMSVDGGVDEFAVFGTKFRMRDFPLASSFDSIQYNLDEWASTVFDISVAATRYNTTKTNYVLSHRSLVD